MSLLLKYFSVVLFLRFASGTTPNACNFNVKMKQMLRSEGFHRNITYGIVFSSRSEHDKWLYEDCIVAVEQVLPVGVFTKPDELKDLRRLKKLKVLMKDIVDEEVPATKASPTSVFLMGTVTEGKVYLWLPVHARYHEAVSGGGIARNDIAAPQLYMRCRDERLQLCDKAVTHTSLRCNGSNNKLCTWKAIPFTLLSEPLLWEVPVGNTEHYYIVAIGTVAALAVGTLYLLNTLHEYRLSLRRDKR